MKRRWRPSLALVLGGALAGTLMLSLLGLIVLRYLGPAIGFKEAAALLALAIGALTLIPWVLMMRLLLRPVRALSEYAGQVRTHPGQLPPAPSHYGTRELRDMGRSVMDMAATLQARETSVRSFADHVTHEVKGPVAAIRAASELLSDGALDPADRKLVDQIDTAAQRIEDQLAALARVTAAREADHRGTTRLDALPLDTSLEVEVRGGNIDIPLAREGLMAVLDHMLANAADHGARQVTLSVRQGDGVTLTITDDGRGISAGNRDRVFQPFFTTRRDSGGTGMGLAIVSALLRANGGGIMLDPNGDGATFHLRWPPV